MAGITVGGGFLALPTVVAPTGFYPSAMALVGVWAFLGAEAWTVVHVLCQIQQQIQKEEEEEEEEEEDDDATTNTVLSPGMAAAARHTFGKVGEVVCTLLLVTVVEATLVSQISRAGLMLQNPSLYRYGCAFAALSMGAIVFGPTCVDRRERITTLLNSVMTGIFSIMAVLLFLCGVPSADWSRLASVQNYKGLPHVIPTFLQLLVYGEILPTACSFLNYDKSAIRWAIGLGSVLPLVLEIGWAALGIGLSPASVGSSIRDPVALLLHQAGPIQVPLFCLALSAILTTILGSYLALDSCLADVRRSASSSRWNKSRWISAGSIIGPALAIASVSPSLFLQAIDFAGSYPVLLLWGVGPPLMAWRLKSKRQTEKNANTLINRGSLPTWWIATLFTISLALFGMSALPDMVRIAASASGIVKSILRMG